jgi:hypothetical protein
MYSTKAMTWKPVRVAVHQSQSLTSLLQRMAHASVQRFC